MSSSGRGWGFDVIRNRSGKQLAASVIHIIIVTIDVTIIIVTAIITIINRSRPSYCSGSSFCGSNSSSGGGGGGGSGSCRSSNSRNKVVVV